MIADEYTVTEIWRQVDEETIAVKISPHLQQTMQGLGVAIRKIPYWKARQYRTFAWAGEETRGNSRWGFIRVGM